MKSIISKVIILILFFGLGLGLAGCKEQEVPAWLTGVDAPETNLGKNGDMYITSEGDLYNKRNNNWYLLVNLQGAAGEDGESVNSIKSARVEDGKLIFTLSDDTQLDAGLINSNTKYNMQFVDGSLTIASERIIRDLDSEAFDGKTFREIFINNNIIKTGNMIDSDDITSTSGWTVNAGSPKLNTINYVTGPTSLDVSGSTSQQLKQTLGVSHSGTLFLASKVKITNYINGFAGLFMLVDGVNLDQGMIAWKTNTFETAVQVVEHASLSYTLCFGSGNSASMTGYVDSAVAINITKTFGSKKPTKEQMTDLYEMFNRLYKGERNITMVENYTINSDGSVGATITNSQAIYAFYEKMAAKARMLGVSLGAHEIQDAIGFYNKLSIQEMLKIAIYATGYEELQKVWNIPSYTTTTQGEVRKFTVGSTVVAASNSKYLTDHYYVLGGKTGTLSNLSNLMTVVEGPDGAIFVGMVSRDAADTASDNRFTRAKVLFDIATAKYLDRNANISHLEAQLTADRAAVVVLPPTGHIFSYSQYNWFGPNSDYHLYSKNGTTKMLVASVWKVLTIITALDYIENLNDTLTVLASDLSSSTPRYVGGEVITYRDALYFMMLPSSNTTCTTIARTLGKMIIEKGL